MSPNPGQVCLKLHLRTKICVCASQKSFLGKKEETRNNTVALDGRHVDVHGDARVSS